MTECACFASALQVSEQLHRTETALTSATFDQVLSIARRASAVCRQYASCPYCADPSYYTLYIIVLRKAAACYSHLVQSATQGSSPGTASTASSAASGVHGWYGATSRLRIGNFEVEAALDDQTKTIILRTEVRRAAETAAYLETVLGPHSVKGAALTSDEAALHYWRSLIATLREEIAAIERFLAMM